MPKVPSFFYNRTAITGITVDLPTCTFMTMTHRNLPLKLSQAGFAEALVKAEEIVRDLNTIFRNSRYPAVLETWNILDCKSVSRIWKILHFVLYTTWKDN